MLIFLAVCLESEKIVKKVKNITPIAKPSPKRSSKHDSLISWVELTKAEQLYLILELQEVEYNEGAPQKDAVIEYLKTIGFVMFCEDFSKNIADSDSCFVNTRRTNFIFNSLN